MTEELHRQNANLIENQREIGSSVATGPGSLAASGYSFVTYANAVHTYQFRTIDVFGLFESVIDYGAVTVNSDSIDGTIPTTSSSRTTCISISIADRGGIARACREFRRICRPR